MIKKIFYTVACLALVACQHTSSAPTTSELQAAVLATNNTQQCYQQLSQSLAQAISYPVHVSPTAFATTNIIFLEPISARQPNGQRKDGMIIDKPTQFKLALNNQQCVLSQVDVEWQSTLTLCLCQAM